MEWVYPFQCRRKQHKKAHRESLLNGLLARHTEFEPVALRFEAQSDYMQRTRDD